VALSNTIPDPGNVRIDLALRRTDATDQQVKVDLLVEIVQIHQEAFGAYKVQDDDA
jgi:hypothetical protein